MAIQDITAEPLLAVGLMTAAEVRVTPGRGFGADNGRTLTFTAADDGVCLSPESDPAVSEFTLHDVQLGTNFHWQRLSRFTYNGALRIVAHNGMVTAINMVPLESYLTSVISSEMSPSSSIGLLRAHAIVSRSWLLYQLHGRKPEASDAVDTPQRLIRWYDRDDHELFDVCADDHCQRYQGVHNRMHPAVAQAIADTRGQVLMYDGDVCDARFSKCCGGVTERFSSCWQPVDVPYLKVVADAADETVVANLEDEDNARRFIMSAPEAYCGRADRQVLDQVLKDYDRETTDYYRWRVVYTPGELSAIVASRTGVDFGEILALEPVRRGPSGRIVELRIRGSRHTCVIGKELEIRRTLSRSHLYSSAFVVDRDADGNWVLSGAGWGHGVGMCQIGAAMMAADGISHRRILDHYFAPAQVVSLY